MLSKIAERRSTTPSEMTRRVLWTFAQPLFRFSPRPCFGWRRFLLRCFGAKIGRSVNVYPSATIYFPWNLEAGDESAISEHVFIYNLGRVTLGLARHDLASRASLRGNTRSYQAGFSAAASADCDWVRRVDLCGCVRGPRCHSWRGSNCWRTSSRDEGRKPSKHRRREPGARKQEAREQSMSERSDARLAYIPSTRIMFVLAVR